LPFAHDGLENNPANAWSVHWYVGPLANGAHIFETQVMFLGRNGNNYVNGIGTASGELYPSSEMVVLPSVEMSWE